MGIVSSGLVAILYVVMAVTNKHRYCHSLVWLVVLYRLPLICDPGTSWCYYCLDDLKSQSSVEDTGRYTPLLIHREQRAI